MTTSFTMQKRFFLKIGRWSNNDEIDQFQPDNLVIVATTRYLPKLLRKLAIFAEVKAFVTECMIYKGTLAYLFKIKFHSGNGTF